MPDVVPASIASSVARSFPMFRRAFCSSLFVCAAFTAHADVTLHQTMEFKMKVPMGPQMPAPFQGPLEMVSHIKGTRSQITVRGTVMITDTAKGEISIVDNATRRFATLPFADYLASLQKFASLPTMPEEARQMLENIKAVVESHDAGRSEKILGIDAAERDVVLNLTIPMPIPGQNGMQITGKFESWKPQAGEEQRVAALAELQKFYSQAQGIGDPTALMNQSFGTIPGLGEHFQTLVQELMKGGPFSLRIHGAFYMPELAAMMAQARAHGNTDADMPGPDTPLLEITIDTKDLTAEALPDSLFEVPAGYQRAEAAELLSAFRPAWGIGTVGEPGAPKQ
jgi:hypothetical protein